MKGSISKRFDKEFISFINENYDLLIIRWGNYSNWKYDFGGLVLAGDIDDLDLLNIPMVVYGAGDNRFSKYDNFEYGDNLSKLQKT